MHSLRSAVIFAVTSSVSVMVGDLMLTRATERRHELPKPALVPIPAPVSPGRSPKKV